MLQQGLPVENSYEVLNEQMTLAECPQPLLFQREGVGEILTY